MGGEYSTFCSYHVLFLEHKPFFSIPDTIHNLTKSDLIHIDPFSDPTDSLSPQVPSTTNSDSSIAPIIYFPFHYSHRVRIVSSGDTGTLQYGALDNPTPPIVAQAPPKIVDSTSRYP